MHEKILQGVTVGVVGGLIVYWLTSRRDYRQENRNPNSYQPMLGDVRTARGRGTCADCQCCGLPVAETTSTPLAADYLDCAPEHEPAISGWNLGVSINTNCGLDARVYTDRMRSSAPIGISGPNTYGRPIRIPNPICCNPQDIPGNVCCGEVI